MSQYLGRICYVVDNINVNLIIITYGLLCEFVPFGTLGVHSGILLIAFFSYAIWKFEAYSYADIIQFCYCQTFVSVPSLGGNVFECFLLLVCLSSC